MCVTRGVSMAAARTSGLLFISSFLICRLPFLHFALDSPLDALKKKLRSYPNMEAELLDVVCPKLISAGIFAYNILGQKEEHLVKLLGEADGSALFSFLHGLYCSFYASE